MLYLKMQVRRQMFIILTLIYPFYSVLADKSGPCDCEVLLINNPGGVIGFQNFTKQRDALNGKPYYISNEKNMISWNGQFWSYDQYNLYNEVLVQKKNYTTELFSFANECNVVNVPNWDVGELVKNNNVRK